MKYRSYPHSPDTGSSVANTRAFPVIRKKFGVPLLIENAVKDGIPMMYWTCLVIAMHGRYAIDVRELPNADASLVDQHGRTTQTAVQRAIAFLLIDAAFPDLDTMVAWCDRNAQTLTDWRPRWTGINARSIFVHGPQACGKTSNARRIADHFGLPHITDGWSQGDPFRETGTLILTNDMLNPDVRRQLSYQEAMALLDKPAGYPFGGGAA